jgi:hypothetical protein
MELFDRIETQRKVWQPNNPASMSEYALWADTVSRCLALTDLEPAVAEFITEGLDSPDTEKLQPAIRTLRRNIEDEAKHELALTRAKAAMTNYSSSFEDEAVDLIKAWKSLPDNPITTAAVLENGVFFIVLPIYSQFGGTSLRITSASISADEQLHVRSHRAAAQLLGAKPSKALNALRKHTVDWLASSLIADGASWTKDRLMRNSDSLMKRGISDLLETRVANVNAPFELSNLAMDSYA